MKEKWKPIPIKEFSDKYMVSNLGTINNCIDILQKCYIGFLHYPNGMIVVD